MSRAAMEQALEALQEVDGPITALLGSLLGEPEPDAAGAKVRAAIAALRAALAEQPAPQEPVAWGWISVNDRLPDWSDDRTGPRVLVRTDGHSFGGEQVHDIPASDFFYFDPDDPDDEGTEVTKVATHWMYRDDATSDAKFKSQPVAWAGRSLLQPDTEDEAQGWEARVKSKPDAVFSVPLYTTPPAPQPREPVAWRYKPMMGSPWSLSDDGYYISCKRDRGYIVEPLYPTPPAPQPLTELPPLPEPRMWYDHGTQRCRGMAPFESGTNEALWDAQDMRAYARAVEREVLRRMGVQP